MHHLYVFLRYMFFHGIVVASAAMFAFDWDAPQVAASFGAFALWVFAIMEVLVACLYDSITKNPDVIANARRYKWMYSTPFWQFFVAVDLLIAGLVAGSGDYVLATIILAAVLLHIEKQREFRKHLEVA